MVDVLGDVLTITNATAAVTRTYDGLGRLAQESDAIGGTTLALSYAYDAAGRLTNVSYPQGQGGATYAYDSLGRVAQVGWNGSEAAAATYDAYGRLARISYFQAGVSTSEAENLSHDVMDRVTAVSVLGTTNLLQLVYAYDPASQVTSIWDNAYPGGASSPRTESFGYDGNGRLASAAGPFSSKTLAGGDNRLAYANFTYDALGNLLERQDSDLGACTSNCRWSSAQTVTYAYAGAYDELTSTGGAKAETFAYDGMGSLTSRSNFAYAFDFQGELVQAKSTSPAYTYTYAYDGVGRKVKEVDAVGSTYTSYFAYLGSTLAYTYNATSRVASSYVYLGDALLFRKDSGSATTHFYATDPSNNVRLVWSYSTAVNVEFKQRYKPFGEQATPLTTSSDPRFRYAEASYSPPTKLYAMGARSYAPDLGRFTSRDPVGGHGYAYAADNPLSFWDPSGLDSQGIDWAAVGAFIVGALVVAGAVAACATGVGCIPVIAALGLAAGAGALTAVGITAYQGGQIGLGTAVNGAFMGVLGGGLVFGFAGAGVFGEAAANAAFDMSWGVPAALSGEEGVGAGAAGLADEEAAAEDLSAGRPSISQIVAGGGIQGGAPDDLTIPEGTAEFFERMDRQVALAADESQLQHAWSRFVYRSPQAAQSLGLSGEWAADRGLWTEINSQVVSEPEGVVSFSMRGEGGSIMAEGYMGESNGVRLITIFNANTGEFITTAVPLPFQETLLAAQAIPVILGG